MSHFSAEYRGRELKLGALRACRPAFAAFPAGLRASRDQRAPLGTGQAWELLGGSGGSVAGTAHWVTADCGGRRRSAPV